MSNKEFEAFLKKEEEKGKKETPIDWEGIKKKWFVHLDKLFLDIQTWLKEYVEDNRIKLGFNNIEIQEEALGKYTVKELIIVIYGKTAQLTPIGTILIGTPGRADLSGPAGTVRFILADRNATGPKIEFKVFTSEEERKKDAENEKKKTKLETEWIWKITSNPPRIKYTELNKETFLQCLTEVING